MGLRVKFPFPPLHQQQVLKRPKHQAPRGPLVGAEMELHASLRPLFRDGYAVVDAHQMRHEAWGSPEGVAFIDSAGCAAPAAHQGGSHPAMR